jgi:hypothetical protein
LEKYKYLVYIITEVWNDRIPKFENINFIKERIVDSIAYVNVKKNAGGTSKSNNNEIAQYAVSDKEFLKRQLNLINPNIIFCGGTINSLKQYLILRQ